MSNDTTEIVLRGLKTLSRPPTNEQLAEYVARQIKQPITVGSMAYHIAKLRKERKIDENRRPI